MKSKILGGIGILWGGFIVLKWLLSASLVDNSDYQSGQSAGVIFGVVLLIVGVFTFFKKTKVTPES